MIVKNHDVLGTAVTFYGVAATAATTYSVATTGCDRLRRLRHFNVWLRQAATG